MDKFTLYHLPRLIAYAIGFPLSYLAFSWLIPVSQFTSNDALLLSLIVAGVQAGVDFVMVLTEEREEQ